MSFVEEIKAKVSLLEMVENLGYQSNRLGKYKCIFHNEKTASMKIYENNTFHCFGCNANGSVIDFVMKYYNLGFMEACKKIDFDYSLNLFLKNPTKKQIIKAKNERLKRQKEKAEKLRIEMLCKIQMEKIINLRRWFWEKVGDDSFFPISYLDRLLDKDDFPLNFDVEQTLKCLYMRWKKEAIQIANRRTDSENNS